MAVSGTTLDRVALVAMDAGGLAAFYVAAFGFAIVAADARHVRLGLGRQELDLLSPSPRGAPCPAEVPGWSLHFQHVAIVAADMAAAYARLQTQDGWNPISQGGPQSLPPSSGGVTAFKFRDPEGHPLELIAFPPDATPPDWRDGGASGPCLGFDHSAISVADTARSVAFYEALGLRVIGGSLNTGAAQARLDAIADPHVEVTALAPGGRATPHVELLRYRGAYPRSLDLPAWSDAVATRLVLGVAPATWAALAAEVRDAALAQPDGSFLLRDPDGHALQIHVR
jgi:catechol 2,3-dioxygenase-like lactoylglutathione lyase family enzyme